MKKWIAVILAAAMCLSLACASAETLTGIAQGFGGEVSVIITTENGKITDVAIEGASETPGVGTNAIEQMPAKMVEANSIEVDGVAGATITSNAILAAAQAALNGAEADGEFVAGEYTVETYGLNAPMTVIVTMDAEGIVAIDVPVHGETIGIGDCAIETVSAAIIEAQSLNVDSVSGATYTSGVLVRAVNEALEMAGGSAAMLANHEIVKDAAVPENTTAQYVVIGGGAAGMTSALYADELGVEVILLEKMDILGGTSVMAGVGTQAGSSKLQLAQENPYTDDEFYEYLTKLGVDVNEQVSTIAPISAEYAYTLAYESGAMMDWLVEDVGLAMTTGDHSNSHKPADGTAGLFGEQLVRALKEKLAASNVDVRMASRATEILMKDGKVCGVKVETENGEYTIETENVAICTGSYGGSEEVLAKFAPSRLGYVSTASKAGTGDGLLLADAVGAKIINAESITYRTIASGTDNVGGAIGLHNAMSAGAIIVNKNGERFVNETGSNEAIVLGIQAQEDGLGYVIMDQTAMDERYNVSALYIPGTYESVFVKADTLDELAEMMGLNAENLKATVEAYGKAVEAGKDEAFGRETAMLSKLDTPPYYAASGKPSNHICAGGIETDGQARVLDAQDQPIEGLYAAGETVNLAYHPLCSAMTFGRVAAEQVAERVAK